MSLRNSRPATRSSGRPSRPGRPVPRSSESLRRHVLELLKGKSAHVDLEGALADFPPKLRGIKPKGAPHTAWQLLEHIRIAQWDILEFSRNPKYVSPGFPEGYWPKTPVPRDLAEWTKSVQSVASDLRAMIRLVMNPRSDLHAAFPGGDGQTLLREVLLLADHNAYHVGQLVDLRRALGIWKKS